MVVEGVGRRPPAPILWDLIPGDIGCIIARSELKAAKYAGQADEWRRGKFARTRRVMGYEVAAHVYGTVVSSACEHGFSAYIRRHLGRSEARVDDRVYAGGDGGVDFWVRGHPVQVKGRPVNRTVNYIRVRDHRGRAQPLKCRFYMFGEWDGALAVKLLGWVPLTLIEKRVPVPGVWGGHLNIEVMNAELEPMSRFLRLMR